MEIFYKELRALIKAGIPSVLNNDIRREGFIAFYSREGEIDVRAVP